MKKNATTSEDPTRAQSSLDALHNRIQSHLDELHADLIQLATDLHEASGKLKGQKRSNGRIQAGTARHSSGYGQS